MSSFCLQDNNNNSQCVWLAPALANQSARSESQGGGSTYLLSPDPLPELKARIPSPFQYNPKPKLTVSIPDIQTQSGTKAAMAVANFHYITRMSSGFKVYILEGKLVYAVSFYVFTSC